MAGRPTTARSIPGTSKDLMGQNTKSSHRPKAVILDMDGVIVDSMPYHFIAWYETLIPYGIRLGCFDVYSREGERWNKTLLDFLKIGGIKPTVRLMHKIFRERARIFKKYFKQTIFPGAFEFLSCLKKKGRHLALVTGSPISEVRTILPVRILRLFDVIVAGDQVKHGKPHPEPYLKSVKLLTAKNPSLAIKDCLVIENAPLGIRSAKAAGLFCAALTTSLPKPYLKKADLIIDTLAELARLC